MNKRPSVRLDLDKMKKLYESLKTRPVIQVGVFADKNSRSGGDMSNATIAAIHELGAPEAHIPPRSMLRTPLHDHAKDLMNSIRGKAVMWLSKNDVKNAWKLIGIAAEKIVLGAFDTEGYGKWVPLKYKTILGKLKGSLKKRKNQIGMIYAGQAGSEILIDSGQLRRAFRSRVVFKF